MTRFRSIPNLHACKSEAKRLLSSFRDGSREAADRLRHVPPLSDASVDDLLSEPERVKLKHAQWAVAIEEGHRDWKTLKDAADFFWYPRMSMHLNAWYARYDDARACLDQNGGYLLTHHGKYFVCEAGYVRSLGLDPDDLRWKAIGHDIARPLDKRACTELVKLAEIHAKKPQLMTGKPDFSRRPSWIPRPNQ